MDLDDSLVHAFEVREGPLPALALVDKEALDDLHRRFGRRDRGPPVRLLLMHVVVLEQVDHLSDARVGESRLARVIKKGTRVISQR